MDRSERRRRTANSKDRAVRVVREVFGLTVGKCETCGKHHSSNVGLDYHHNWSKKKTVDWLKNDQDDRRLDRYNSEIGKPINPPDERLRVTAREQLNEEDQL